MAFDQKLVAQLLDLSRNVEKLSGEVKKNTTVNKDLVKSDAAETKSPVDAKSMAGIAEGLKSMDLKGLKDEFKGLKEGLKGIDKLDFKGLENGLKSLDFKGLEKGLKGLDFKGLEKGLKGFDVKTLTESFKGITDLKNMDIGGMAKNLVSGGGVKDLISGSIGNIGKGLLGGFEKGGDVKIPGAYLVGEKGPEIANLPKNTNVIPNDKTEAILSGKPAAINTLTKPGKSSKSPSKEEIAAKRSELIASDPKLYSDKDELEYELQSYIENYKNGGKPETFTKEDVAKLGKSTNKAVSTESPADIKRQVDAAAKASSGVNEANKNSELSEKKPGLFSKLFSKENIKNVGGKIEGAAGGMLGGGLKDKLTGTLKGSAESLINKESLGIPDFAKSSLTSGLSFLNKGQKERQPELLGDIKKNMPTLLNLPSIKTKTETPAQTSATPVNQAASALSPAKSIADNAIGEITKGTNPESAAETKPGDKEGITKKDIDTIISLLSRMGSLLEGPLSISPMDSPLRPDSRRV